MFRTPRSYLYKISLNISRVFIFYILYFIFYILTKFQFNNSQQHLAKLEK